MTIHLPIEIDAEILRGRTVTLKPPVRTTPPPFAGELATAASMALLGVFAFLATLWIVTGGIAL